MGTAADHSRGGGDRNVIRFTTGPPVVVQAAGEGEDADLLEYARVLWKHRKPLAGGVLAVMVVTAIVNLLLTPVYRASASVLPVTGGGGPTIPPALLQMAGAAGLGTSLKGSDPTDRFLAILKSETVAEDVITKLQLEPVLLEDQAPEDRDMRAAIRAMREKVLSVDTSAEGAIEVSAEWTDPQLAADIANEAVAQLERFLREKDLSLAARHRTFIAERRIESRKALAEAENTLKSFSTKHGFVSVSEQTRALFEAIGRMHAEIAIAESRLDAMRQFRGPTDPELKQRELELHALKNRLVELEHGPKDDPTMKVQANGYVPLYQLPEVGLQYSRLLREVTVQNEVFTLLSGELERAKIDERREEIAVQVLDRARAPDRKHRPRRTQNTLLAGVVAAFLGVLLAFGAEGVAKLKARAAAEAALAAAEGTPATTA